MPFKTLIVGLVAVASLVGAAGVTSAPVGAVAPSATSAPDGQVASLGHPVPYHQMPETPHLASMHPNWVRSCGFANCSVYFNKSETRIAAYGGALLSSLICTMLRSTPAALVCTAISWAVGKAGDNAVSGGSCVKLSFSRWTGVVYYIGTYRGSQCR